MQLACDLCVMSGFCLIGKRRTTKKLIHCSETHQKDSVAVSSPLDKESRQSCYLKGIARLARCVATVSKTDLTSALLLSPTLVYK